MKDKEIYTLVVYRSSADLWKRCTNHDAQVIWHKPPKSYEIIDWFWSCIKKQGSKYKIVKFRRTKKEQVEFILSCQTRKRGEGFVVYFDSIPADSQTETANPLVTGAVFFRQAEPLRRWRKVCLCPAQGRCEYFYGYGNSDSQLRHRQCMSTAEEAAPRTQAWVGALT